MQATTDTALMHRPGCCEERQAGLEGRVGEYLLHVQRQQEEVRKHDRAAAARSDC
jgi:hypothetical protein